MNNGPFSSIPEAVKTPTASNTPTAFAETVDGLKADLLTVYRAVIALEKRVNESTVNIIEIKPQLIALKVHSESFPSALRELRRSQTVVQKAVSELEIRLQSLESRVKGVRSQAAV